jgi:hypothetical protein
MGWSLSKGSNFEFRQERALVSADGNNLSWSCPCGGPVYLFTNVVAGDLANLVPHSVLNATPNISSIHNLTRYQSRLLAHQWPLPFL